MLMPRAVASSIASMPARVAGILTIMLGASASKRTRLVDDRRGVLIQARVGLNRQPPVAAAVSWQTPAAAAPPRRSTTLQPPPRRCRPRSPPAARASTPRCAAAIRRAASSRPCARSPDCRSRQRRPVRWLQRSSSGSAESFHRHVAVVCVISCSGLFHAAPVDMRGIIEQLRRSRVPAFAGSRGSFARSLCGVP